jgi:hypothetical protein
MPGEFTVVGALRLAARGVVVVYGDLVRGDVADGEILIVPRPGESPLRIQIASVEAIDKTATGSHLALLLPEETDPEMLLRRTFSIEAPAGDEVPMSFDEAKERLAGLLASAGWPSRIVWLEAARVRQSDRHVSLFRPNSPQPEESAREAFERARQSALAVRVGAVGFIGATTFAVVWPIREFGQGEPMFIWRQTKINMPAEAPVVKAVTSRLKWWLAGASHR